MTDLRGLDPGGGLENLLDGVLRPALGPAGWLYVDGVGISHYCVQ